MTIKGGDYSVARPDPALLKKTGWEFVCRYMRDLDKSNGDKSLSRAEADALRAAGLTIVANDETTSDRGLQGYDAGVFDAGEAHQAAVRCGMPPARPIYFSPWDHDPAALSPENKAKVFAYLRGTAQVLGSARVGFYAGVELVREAFDNHFINWGWEAAGWRKGLPVDPRTHIVQHISAPWQLPGTDANTAMKDNYGQWDVITLADASDIITAIVDLKKLVGTVDDKVNQHTDEIYRLTQRGELANGGTDGRVSLTTIDTRLAVIEAAVQSGVPVNLTNEQFAQLAADVAAKLSTSGLKLSGTVKGTLDATAELGADA